jgi:hypothetical protein
MRRSLHRRRRSASRHGLTRVAGDEPLARTALWLGAVALLLGLLESSYSEAKLKSRELRSHKQRSDTAA